MQREPLLAQEEQEGACPLLPGLEPPAASMPGGPAQPSRSQPVGGNHATPPGLERPDPFAALNPLPRGAQPPPMGRSI